MCHAARGDDAYIQDEIAAFLLSYAVAAAAHPIHGESMYELSTTRLRVVTPPASEPLTLSEAKVFLRIDHDDDNALILRSITAVRSAAEHYLSYALLPQTLEYKIDYPQDYILPLSRGPASSIISVISTDDVGTDTVWVNTNYRISSDGFAILLKQQPYAAVMTVQYNAALSNTASALPPLIRQGMLHHLAVAMEARDGSAAMPAMTLQCYQPFRRISL